MHLKLAEDEKHCSKVSNLSSWTALHTLLVYNINNSQEQKKSDDGIFLKLKIAGD